MSDEEVDPNIQWDADVEEWENQLGVWNNPVSPEYTPITPDDMDGFDNFGFKAVGADIWELWEETYRVHHLPHYEDTVEVEFYKPYRPFMWDKGFIEDDAFWQRAGGKYSEDKPE